MLEKCTKLKIGDISFSLPCEVQRLEFCDFTSSMSNFSVRGMCKESLSTLTIALPEFLLCSDSSIELPHIHDSWSLGLLTLGWMIGGDPVEVVIDLLNKESPAHFKNCCKSLKNGFERQNSDRQTHCNIALGNFVQASQVLFAVLVLMCPGPLLEGEMMARVGSGFQ